MHTQYWNRFGLAKTFTHPFNMDLFASFVQHQARIIDFGCGYGRITEMLGDNGFANVFGYDTSEGLIGRGKQQGVGNIAVIGADEELPVDDGSIDCFILFAVLTCIPENEKQQKLVDTLYRKLKPGGIIYISDYYLQTHSSEVKQYLSFGEEDASEGVFEMSDGGVFRHHPKAYIRNLVNRFVVKKEYLTPVKTMNGNDAEAFQMILQKNL